MATCTHRVTTANTAASPLTSGAFTPALNDLLIVFVVASGTVQDPAQLSSSVGTTFTQIARATYNSSTNSVYAFVANKLVISATSQTVTFSCPSDASTGQIIAVCSVSGLTRMGISAIRQYKTRNNQGSGTAPSATFDLTTLTVNPLLGVVGNTVNAATLSPPADWTERADTGYGSPSTGLEYATRDSGFAGTVITWGSNSISGSGTIILEINTSRIPRSVGVGHPFIV